MICMVCLWFRVSCILSFVGYLGNSYFEVVGVFGVGKILNWMVGW